MGCWFRYDGYGLVEGTPFAHSRSPSLGCSEGVYLLGDTLNQPFATSEIHANDNKVINMGEDVGNENGSVLN